MFQNNYLLFRTRTIHILFDKKINLFGVNPISQSLPKCNYIIIILSIKDMFMFLNIQAQ